MRCFSVLGPSHSGKSTLVEKLGSLEGEPKKTTSPYGISLTKFNFMGDEWCAIDVPGTNEALAHANNALLASDACILCVSPDPDSAVLAAPYLRAIEASGTPCVLFVNRMDEPRGRLRDIVAAIQDYSNHALVLRQMPIREGDTVVGVVDLISERAWRYREQKTSMLVDIPESAAEREQHDHTELLELLSEYDDWLLEELIEDRHPPSDAVYSVSARVLQENQIIPVFVGAASHNNGVMRLMKQLRHEAPPLEVLKNRLAAASEIAEDKLVAVSFHSYHRQNVGKTVLTRALNSGLKQGVELAGANLGSVQNPATNKPFSGEVADGQIFAALKSDHLQAPSLLTSGTAIAAPDWTKPPTPMFNAVLEPTNERDETKLSGTLARLAETDSGLETSKEEGSGAQQVCVQGPLHLRNIRETLAEIFHVDVGDRLPRPTYRETITKKCEVSYRHRKQSGGAGQFADVKLTVQPLPRGEGFAFTDSVKGGAVPRNYIPAVETGAKETLAKGPLGFPAIDVSVHLTDGRHHSVDSSDFAFRAAGRMGVQQALSEASPVLLQPIFKIEFHIPSVYSGNLVPVVSSMKGQVLGFDRDENAKGWDVFRALVPGSVLEELARSVRSSTQGIGYFDSTFDHFEELYGKEAEIIVAEHAEET